MPIRTPLLSTLRWFSAPEQNFLRWALALSLLVHAGALAWQAPFTQTSTVAARLVNTYTDTPPLTPQVLAQADLEGGGQTQEPRIASNPMPRVGLEDEDLSLQALTEHRQQLESEQDQLLTQLQSIWVTGSRLQPGQTAQDSPQEGLDEVDQRELELNARIAALLDDIERYNQRPRKVFDAPAALASPMAAYLDAWRARVEQIGSTHYPGSGDQAPRGDLQASVTIAANGSVVDITIERPSSDPRLNQAVRRIVELAQPFAPFPDHLAKEADQLVITRTWRFTPGSLSMQTP
jgi:protein TonB